MPRITRAAERQLSTLLDHYERKNRPNAIAALVEVVDEVMRLLSREPLPEGRAFPKPYPQVERFGFTWFEYRNYHVAYVVRDGEAVLTNLIHMTGNVPGLAEEEGDSREY